MSASLGATLLALRQQHGWSLAQAAHATGITFWELLYYERDWAQPPPQTLQVMATAYAVELETLVGLAVERPAGNGDGE